MSDPINPEKLAPTVEAPEQRIEVKPEANEQIYTQGAEMLEEPKSGSFVSALQVFVAWVKTIVAGDK